MGEEANQVVDRKLVSEVAAYAETRLTAALQGGAGPTLSAATNKAIAKRVAPKALGQWSSPAAAAALLTLEAEDIGERIRIYPFTARYREHMNSSSKEMLLAWQMHSHSLRQGEIYIVLGRSIEFLRFVYSLASDFGLPATDRSKEFEKKFKKKFERRLRERHRLVHAHERPSLTSRTIELLNSAEGNPAVTLGSVVSLLAALTPLLSAHTKPPEGIAELLRDIVAQYGAMADREAWDMLAILRESIVGTFPPDRASSPAEPTTSSGG